MNPEEDPNILRSVKGHTYFAPNVAICDDLISALNERVHLATESGRLLSWVPIWKADIDLLLDRRSYLAMLPSEVT